MTFVCKEIIVPTVKGWFQERDGEIDTTAIDMVRMGADAFAERYGEIIEDHIDQDGRGDLPAVSDALDEEFSSSLPAALRTGIAMLIAWRMDHPNEGFMIDMNEERV